MFLWFIYQSKYRQTYSMLKLTYCVVHFNIYHHLTSICCILYLNFSLKLLVHLNQNVIRMVYGYLKYFLIPLIYLSELLLTWTCWLYNQLFCSACQWSRQYKCLPPLGLYPSAVQKIFTLYFYYHRQYLSN